MFLVLEERFFFILGLWPYTVPLLFVYVSEYAPLGTAAADAVDDLERFKFQLKCWGGWEFYILATHERWGCLGCGPRDHSLRLLRNNTGLRVVGVRTCSTWSQGTQEWKTWCILRKHQLIEDMLMKD